MSSDIQHSHIAISIDFKKNRVRIHKKTLALLGMPKYIQFLVNPTKMIFAINSVERANPKDQIHKITTTKTAKDSYDIYSLSLINNLYAILKNINKSRTYRFMGEIQSDKQMALFSLNSAQEIYTP